MARWSGPTASFGGDGDAAHSWVVLLQAWRAGVLRGAVLQVLDHQSPPPVPVVRPWWEVAAGGGRFGDGLGAVWTSGQRSRDGWHDEEHRGGSFHGGLLVAAVTSCKAG
jgi:hypothetical protein